MQGSFCFSMNYEETIERLFERVTLFQNVGAAAYKPGLEGVMKLSEAFGNPHLGLRTVHVAGTNGKGSVSSLIASILQESGLHTGLFTSPHLVDFRERIRIDGEMIPREAVVDFIERFEGMNLPFEPSFFELTTVMAFDWFARNNVDVAVIEVGLGGRLDSTNIINPLLSVITNISFDHTAQLGNTLEAITSEKAGIIKSGIPAVIGNAKGVVRRVFEEKAAAVGAPSIFAQDSKKFDAFKREDTHIIYIGTNEGDIKSPLTGDCQPENAATVLTALPLLRAHFSINDESVRRGFENVCRNTGLTGRWTTVSERPRVICDTGHNAGGWEWLGPRLRDIASNGRLHIVAGFVNDKDIAKILAMMPRRANFYFATPSVKRGRPASEVADEALKSGIAGLVFDSVEQAVKGALAAAGDDDTVFVGGSTFVVADLLSSGIFKL